VIATNNIFGPNLAKLLFQETRWYQLEQFWSRCSHRTGDR
jgi:hypothetical protein